MTNMDYNEFEALLNDYLPEEGNTGSKVVGTVASKERNFAYLDVPGQITSVRVRAEEVENYNVGDEIEVSFGRTILTVKVLMLKDHVLKDEASSLYEIIKEEKVEEETIY